MLDWYPRTVFFVDDVGRALAFYLDALGFAEDWVYEERGAPLVAQVSRWGFELILNRDAARAGSGRVFVSLHDEQVAPLRAQVEAQGVATSARSWGMPITAMLDPDGNELYFSPPLWKPDQGRIS